MRILVVHATSGSAFGDRIRVEKVQESLTDAGFEVFNLRLPIVQRYDLLVPSNLKNLLVSILSLKNPYRLESTFSFPDILDFVIFNISLEFLRKKVRMVMPDIILAETSKVGLITSIVSNEFLIPCIVDVHGLTFAEAIGLKQKNWQHVMRIEIEALENCSHVVVVSRKMKDYLTKKMGISKAKIIVALNGSEPQTFHAEYSKPLNVIFAGGFTYWEKVQDFVEVAKQANPQEFKFYLAGDGPSRNELLEKIKKENIPVAYLGHIPKQRIFAVLSKMQVGIAPSTMDLARQVASPIKIFDYMASGLPVITPNIGDWGQIIRQENCGIALDNDSTENYVKALNALAQEDIWKAKSRNAIKAIQEKYYWAKVLEPITNLLLAYEK
jgi:glycosyltransferase involved in cell wall biosynthesis